MKNTTERKMGFFLVIDGIDGCGKSTQSKLIQKYYKKRGTKVHLTSEPSQGQLGKILRQYLTDDKIPTALDALLFAADRIDHCYREILPKLKEGQLVVSDRYRDSSYIYQSVQGMSKQENVSMEWVKTINEKSFNPDLTIILDIDPKLSLNRRIKYNKENAEELEKFEQVDFQKQVRKEFLKIAKNKSNQNVDRHVVVDGSRPIEKVFEEIISILEDSPMRKKCGL